MKCPNCNNETSDMLTRCEWCGASLHQGSAQAPADRPGPMAAPPQGYSQAPGSYEPPPAGFPPPSDASYPGYEQGGWGAQRQPVQPVLQPWYKKPSTYIAGLIVLIAIIAGFIGYKAVKGLGPRYANLVVAGQPTVLDFYTDT